MPDIALTDLLALLISAAVLMASPGPATMSVAATAAAFGFRDSLSYAMGINLGTILVLLAVALGASTLLQALPQLVLPVTIAASLYILYLAFRIATAPPLSAEAADQTAPGVLPGLALAVANPKAYLAIGAVYAKAILVPSNAVADAILKCILLCVAIVIIHTVWALAGSALTATLRNPKASRWINLTLALALVVTLLLDIS